MENKDDDLLSKINLSDDMLQSDLEDVDHPWNKERNKDELFLDDRRLWYEEVLKRGLEKVGPEDRAYWMVIRDMLEVGHDVRAFDGAHLMIEEIVETVAGAVNDYSLFGDVVTETVESVIYGDEAPYLLREFISDKQASINFAFSDSEAVLHDYGQIYAVYGGALDSIIQDDIEDVRAAHEYNSRRLEFDAYELDLDLEHEKIQMVREAEFERYREVRDLYYGAAAQIIEKGPRAFRDIGLEVKDAGQPIISPETIAYLGPELEDYYEREALEEHRNEQRRAEMIEHLMEAHGHLDPSDRDRDMSDPDFGLV